MSNAYAWCKEKVGNSTLIVAVVSMENLICLKFIQKHLHRRSSCKMLFLDHRLCVVYVPWDEIAVWIALKNRCQDDLGCCICYCHGTDRRGVLRADFPCGGMGRYIICSFVDVFAVYTSHRPPENCHRITIAAIKSMVIVLINIFFIPLIRDGKWTLATSC